MSAPISLEYQTSTHVFKTVRGLDLTLDVLVPKGKVLTGNEVAVIRYHGGFLVGLLGITYLCIAVMYHIKKLTGHGRQGYWRTSLAH